MDSNQAARVRLSAGPFVEGAMAASVQASIGMDLEAVAAEAAEAMRPKIESLGFQPVLLRPIHPDRPLRAGQALERPGSPPS